MYRFQCDYTEGAHPAIMQRMVETNMEQTDGYGLDPYCDSARQKIKDLCECQDADVHFLVGGTQTNTTVISAALRPYQGAVAAVSGHINVHETGAIEATGHKVLPLPSGDGKISAVQVDEMCHDILQMEVRSIWCSREWYIFPTLQRMEHCIQRKN